MRPYVPPSTHPFSVNLYLGLIRVMAGVLEPLAAFTGQGKDTYLWAVYLEKPTNNQKNTRGMNSGSSSVLAIYLGKPLKVSQNS